MKVLSVPGMDEAKSLSILMCGEDQMGWEEPACHGATPTNKQRVTKPVELVGAVLLTKGRGKPKNLK